MAALKDPQVEKAEELIQQQQQFLDELRKSRHHGYSQPRNLLGTYAPRAKGAVGPFQSFRHFLKSVRECPNGVWHHHRDMASYIKALPTGMNETAGADGGYLVPPDFANQLLMRTYDNDLLARTFMFPLTNSNSIKIPAINETSRADGSRFGGVQAFWRSEGGSVSRSKAGLKQITLTVDSLTCMVQVTQELLDDASGMALEQFLNLVAPQEMSFKIGDAIVNGDGVTKPLGIMESTAKVTQSKDVGQAAGTITATNVLNMWSRLHVSCRQNAVWLVDQTCEPKLGTMTIGTAGSNLVVYQPAGGLSAAPYATLMGKPVLPVEFCQQVGTEGDIILTDLSTYLTAAKGGLQTAVSMHVLFESNEMLYRFILRIDGKPWWLAPLTPKSGGPTQSCIVTLETRS